VNNVCGNGTVSGEAQVAVLIPLATEKHLIEGLKLFPVPAQDYLDIVLNSEFSGEGYIEIINFLGQTKVSTFETFQNGKTRIQLNNLVPGLYILSTTANSQSFTNQIIVQ